MNHHHANQKLLNMLKILFNLEGDFAKPSKFTWEYLMNQRMSWHLKKIMDRTGRIVTNVQISQLQIPGDQIQIGSCCCSTRRVSLDILLWNQVIPRFQTFEFQNWSWTGVEWDRCRWHSKFKVSQIIQLLN